MLITITAIAACILGYLGCFLVQRFRLGGFQAIANQLIQQAETEATSLKRRAEIASQEKRLSDQQELEKTWQTERKKLMKEEERLEAREDKLETRLHLVEKKLADIEKREAALNGCKNALEEERNEISLKQQALIRQLEEASHLSSSKAKELLLNKIEEDVKGETVRYIRRAKEEAESLAEDQARKLIATAINRLASATVSETSVCLVAIPSEEMKGRIIGREGRNIRALEKATGVNFVMDDTPLAVVISGYDPLRKQIAKSALTELVLDGRIHPTRIEEAVEKATAALQKQIRQFGEDAAYRAGVMNLHPELINYLGKLKFRYSLGQNVLEHSLEVARLMGIIAAELNLDVSRAKRIGLLHDFGKAVSHEVEGTHALIGHDLALKYGESKEVANGIGCHHFEIDPITIEGSLCSAADAISASRPGARIEAVEEYFNRLKRLEELALEFQGVEKAYALQAGREIRVIVTPDALTDDEMVLLARNLTKKIEKELEYSGKIRVTLLREKRVVDYAL